jgi:hypothetical protein
VQHFEPPNENQGADEKGFSILNLLLYSTTHIPPSDWQLKKEEKQKRRKIGHPTFIP